MDKKLDEELPLPLDIRKKANPILFTLLGKNIIGTDTSFKKAVLSSAFK